MKLPWPANQPNKNLKGHLLSSSYCRYSFSPGQNAKSCRHLHAAQQLCHLPRLTLCQHLPRRSLPPARQSSESKPGRPRHSAARFCMPHRIVLPHSARHSRARSWHLESELQSGPPRIGLLQVHLSTESAATISHGKPKRIEDFATRQHPHRRCVPCCSIT